MLTELEADARSLFYWWQPRARGARHLLMDGATLVAELRGSGSRASVVIEGMTWNIRRRGFFRRTKGFVYEVGADEVVVTFHPGYASGNDFVLADGSKYRLDRVHRSNNFVLMGPPESDSIARAIDQTPSKLSQISRRELARFRVKAGFLRMTTDVDIQLMDRGRVTLLLLVSLAYSLIIEEVKDTSSA